MRKAYGGAYIVMDSVSLGADLAFAWPAKEIAVMGADAAAEVIFRRQIAGSPHPETTRREHVETYRDLLMHPYYGAENGLVDDVINPRRTRSVLIEALAMLSAKSATQPDRKHGNPPI